MANKKFINYFKKSLIKEDVSDPLEPNLGLPSAAAPAPEGDAAALASSFEDEAGLENLESEISNASLDPEQTAGILKKADKYASNIDKIILPLLRSLHNDIINGAFKSISPDIKDISGITVDLAGLAEALRGKTRDAVLKNEKEREKANKR